MNYGRARTLTRTRSVFYIVLTPRNLQHWEPAGLAAAAHPRACVRAQAPLAHGTYMNVKKGRRELLRSLLPRKVPQIFGSWLFNNPPGLLGFVRKRPGR